MHILKFGYNNYLSMPADVLPTTRHVKELIEHAEQHLLSGFNWDMKVSLIHADNSIEIMLKEHARAQLYLNTSLSMFII